MIIIPLVLVGLFTNSIYTRVLISKSIQTVEDDSDLIITQLNSILKVTEASINTLLLEIDRTEREVEQMNATDKNELLLRNVLQTKLSLATMNFEDIDSAVFVDFNHNIYATDDFFTRGSQFPFINETMNKVMTIPTIQSVWFPMRKTAEPNKNGETFFLTLAKKVMNTETGDIYGVVLLNIREGTIANLYRNVGETDNRDYYIASSEGVISSVNKERVLKPIMDEGLRNNIITDNSGAELLEINGEDKLVTTASISHLGWKLMSETPLSILTKETKKVSRLLFYICCICLICALIFAGLLSKMIVNPLIKLTATMNQIKRGNFQVRSPIVSEDEVGLVASVLNQMINRINELVVDISIQQKKKREMELALIQMQIKPHFLYNTLDLIYVMTRAGEYKESENATLALARFYRTVLSQGKEIITIADEINNVKNYLIIQHSRYADIFEYEINIPDEVAKSEILKLTLQPLVENSIYHGLKYKVTPGKVSITGYLEEERIIISVLDTGIGIPAEKIKSLFSENNISETGSSFGFKSVDERIKLHFGEAYGLSVRSEYGSWTEVRITLPNVGGND